MIGKKLPFTKEQIEKITAEYPTPFHIYDEKGMRAYARMFNDAFSWNEGFKEYYAIKAAPNPFLMKLLRKEGLGIDCSSMAELVLAERTGMRGEEIMFTSNDTPAEEFRKAAELGAIINLDDIEHIDYLEKHAASQLISLGTIPEPEGRQHHHRESGRIEVWFYTRTAF